jgi:FSR family fosmidomycin resistance protein-like MFS transporter
MARPLHRRASLRSLYTARPLDPVPAESFRRDVRVIGIVGVAHAVSHVLQLTLPPLFPLLRAEFDVSWTLLGTLVGVFYLASAGTQFAAGFLVDRYGARPVLLGGMALAVAGTVLAALAPGAWWLFPFTALVGAGNGVFHPADFAILNASVAPRRLGHAYSMHGVGGNLGYAIAPVVSFGLGSAFGWRIALATMGLAALLVLAFVWSQRAHLGAHRASTARHDGVRGSMRLFLQPAILLCFSFFALQTAAGVGLQTFLPAGLNAALGLPLAIGTTAVTAYLLGGVAGIVAGGFIAAGTRRHDRVAAAGLFSGAMLLVMVTSGLLPSALAVAGLAGVGFLIGAIGPSRDLIVRAAAPREASGRVYGFVYSGLDLGGTLGPIVFGLMLDQGFARGVFFLIAALYLAAIATVVNARRTTAVPAAA